MPMERRYGYIGGEDMEGLPTYPQLLEFIGKTEHIDR